MNFDDWRPIHRNIAGYLNDLEAYVEKFIPWLVETDGYEPQLILPPSPAAALQLEYANWIARKMITGVAVTNARSWQEAARKSLRGRQIYQALRTEMGGPVGVRVSELVRQNVKLIEAIPDKVYRQASAWIGAEQRRGTRAGVIAEALRKKMPGALLSQVRTMARTEVGRAETALTRARAERLGLAWYEWATSQDQRVRPSHKLLSSVLVAWGDPPNPELLDGERSRFGHYHPGSVPNCRCLGMPLIDLNEVRWPHKVYSHGVIAYVTRAQFERWIRVPEAA